MIHMKEADRERLGRKYRAARKKLQKTIEELADDFLSPSTISNIERGIRVVSEEKYVAYARKLGLEENLFGILTETKRKEIEAKNALLDLENIIDANPIETLKKLEALNEKYEIEDFLVESTPFYYFLVGKSLLELKKWRKAKKYLADAANLIDQVEGWENSNIKSACYNELSLISYYESKLHKALAYTDKGLKSFIHDGQRKHVRYVLLLNQAIYMEKLDRHEEAYQTLQILYKEKEDFQSILRLTIQMYERFAAVLNNLNMPKQALEYAEKGIEIAINNKYFDRLFSLWTTVGRIYFDLERYEEAERYFTVALAIKNKVKRKNLLAICHIYLGNLHIETQDFELAEKHLKKAIKIAEKYNDIPRKIEALMALGASYTKRNLYQQAIDYYKLAEELLNNINALTRLQVDNIMRLCRCYKEIGYKETYFEYLEKLFFAKENLNGGEKE